MITPPFPVLPIFTTTVVGSFFVLSSWYPSQYSLSLRGSSSKTSRGLLKQVFPEVTILSIRASKTSLVDQYLPCKTTRKRFVQTACKFWKTIVNQFKFSLNFLLAVIYPRHQGSRI